MQNSIKYLLVGFVLLIAISWAVINGNKSSLAQEEFLVPQLQSQINDIDTIVISRNDKVINLSKSDDTWRITQADNFIADANKVASLLLELRKFKLKERKTKNPNNYGRLSLAESGADAATIIKLLKGESEIANISIGKNAQKSQGIYVRKNNEEGTWLAEGELNLKLESNDWIVTTVFDVDISQVKSVTFKTTESESFSINKLSPQDQNFVLANMSDNHQLKAGLDINTLANGLQKFGIETIANKQNLSEQAMLAVDYQLFSGLQYQLSFYQQGDKVLMTVTFENLGSNNQYEDQLTQWAYVIAQYKFDALNKKLSEVVELIPATNEIKE